MRRARTSSWERDAEGHRLSVVVATDKVFPYIGDRGCDPLRPVFIDGPGVAHGYDDGYRLCGHINMKRDCIRKDLGRTYKAARKFPVMVLVKTLFTFISRGHKTLVFMPSTYDERTANGTRSHDLSALIDDTKLLRQIVQLELVQFVDEERNFPFAIRNLARRAYGVLITSDIIPLIDVFDKSVKRRNDDGSTPSRIVNASNMEDKSNSSCKTGSVDEDEQVSKWEGVAGQSVLEVGGRLAKKIMRTNNGTFVEELPIDFLPIVSLIYFNQNNERRILVPLDLPCFSGTFPTTDQVLVFPKRLDGDTAIAELARNSQLTLFKQCKLLEKLDILLDNQYPRGAKEKNVAELVKEAWLETGESDSDTDHLTKSSIRVIGNSLKSGNDNVATVNEHEDEAMSEPSDLILFDDDFSDTVDERRHKHGETSSIDFDLVLFDDDFAAAHDLTEL
uniref:Zc3h12a-like Ribonuclease NYN domain-containing protein n=1 Tax=Parascaris univalens TaxID=6257 RepID=A0A915BZ69_PARUN